MSGYPGNNEQYDGYGQQAGQAYYGDDQYYDEGGYGQDGYYDESWVLSCTRLSLSLTML